MDNKNNKRKWRGWLVSTYVACRQRTRRAVAAVEFALTIPIWITLLLGVSDATYILLVNEKADRIAFTVADIVTQYQSVSKSTLNDILLAAQQLMSPFSFGANGTVIISSVYKSPGKNPTVVWQYSGGGSLVKNSQVGSSGGSAVLPNGLTLNDSDNVIIAEVFYNYTPLFINEKIFTQSTLYRVAVYKPRLSPLVTPPT